MPVLVIDGTADHIFPFEHAHKLCELLPRARLLPLDDVGHVFPYPDLPRVTDEVIAHLRQAAGAGR